MDEYVADPNTYPSNKELVLAYKEGVRTGHMIQPTVHPHFISRKPDLSIYRMRSCVDALQPCDLGRKEWTWGLQDQLEQVLTQQSQEKPKSNI